MFKITEAARPISWRMRWTHAECGIEMLQARRLISGEAAVAAIASYRARRLVQELPQQPAAQSPRPPQAEFVDEHTPIVTYTRSCAPGTKIAVDAGAGSGKTTLAEQCIIANKLKANGEPAMRLAVSSTRAGCHALQSRSGIPDSIVVTLHALGLRGLTSHYHAKHHHVDAELDGSRDQMEIRLEPRSVQRSAKKHAIMLHHMYPRSEDDRHSDPPVSLEYSVNVVFVLALADKMLLFGFGAPGRPDYDNEAAQYELVVRFDLQIHVETAFDKLNAEASARYARFFPTAEARITFAMHMTAQVLYESIELTTNPTWKGRQKIQGWQEKVPADIAHPTFNSPSHMIADSGVRTPSSSHQHTRLPCGRATG